MKKILTVLAAVVLSVSVLSAQHPRLLLTDSDMKALRAKVDAGEEVPVLMHEAVMRLADESVASTQILEYVHDKSGRRILHWSRRALSRIGSCAYAYRYTGDRRYLERALDDMRTVCMFPNWNAGRHYLDAAEMALAVGVGYDWLYDDVPFELRALAEKAVRDFAVAPSRRKNGISFYWRTNNWNQVCNCGLVVSSLGMFPKTEPDVIAVVDSCKATNRKSMEMLYAPDGNYAEGPVYWNYGTGFEVIMLSVMEDILGTDFGLSETPGFMRTADYVTFSLGAAGKFFNYADNGAAEMSSAALWYFAMKQNRPELLYRDVTMLREKRYARGETARMTPLLMGYVARTDCSSIGRPTAKYFSGRGSTPVVMAHTDWTFSPSDKYLGIKGGKAGAPHGHMDAGTFVYDAYGYRWSMEYTRASYADLEVRMAEIGGDLWDMTPESRRWDIFRYNNRQHSTLTINDANHFVPGKAEIVEEFKDGRYLGATLDLSPVFEFQAAKVMRTVRIVDEKYLEVRDEVTALDTIPAHVRWTMITPSEAVVARSGIVLKQGNVRVKLHTESTGAAASYTTWSADPADYGCVFADIEKKGEGISHVGFEADVKPGTTAVFVTTLKKL